MTTTQGEVISTTFFSSKALLKSLQDVSRSLHISGNQFLPPNTVLLCAVGLGFLVDGVYTATVWFRNRRALNVERAVNHHNGPVKFVVTDELEDRDEEAKACLVQQYSDELCKAILGAPRTSPGSWARSPPADAVAEYETLPEPIRLLWEDRVRYTLDAREVVGLLRRRLEPHLAGSRYGPSAALMALLWRLQLLRTVHESIVIAGDVGRCNAELTELGKHTGALYREFISTLHAPVRVPFDSCWECLSAEDDRLRGQARALQLRNLWSLTRYVFAGGLDKLCTYGMVGLLTAFAARSASAICTIRVDVEQLLPNLFGTAASINTGGTTGDGAIVSWTAMHIVVARLLVSEWMLHMLRLGITRVTQDYTHASAAWRRDTVKHRLYDALTRTPLSYFDKTERYAVEEIVYYVNDLEGVDVFVHDFFTRLAQSGISLCVALRVLDMRSAVTVMGAVAGASLLNASLSFLKKTYCALSYCNGIGVEAVDSPSDAEEEENRKDTTDHLMFCGMDIIEHIPELRPYGADTKLMEWWNNYTAHYRRRSCGLRRVFQLTYNSRYLWAIDALKPVARWLLPAIVAANAAGTCQIQVFLLEAIRASQDVLERVVDVQRVVDVVGYNAYKAGVLERILDSKNWEDGDTAERICEHTDKGNISDTTALTCDMNGGTYKKNKEDGELRLKGNDVEVLAVRANGLQFRYPTAPTVDAFLKPASFQFELRNRTTGLGRLVCITGVSGCGKTTLLRLLLGLYAPENPNTLLLEFRLRRHHVSESNGGGTGNSGNKEQWAPVELIPRAQLRSTFFSYVPQAPTIFPGATIAQNVSLRNRVSITDTLVLERVRVCTEAAGCGHFIKRLPNGIMTPLCVNVGWATPDAVRLSCGQGQRLMLARALFHCSSVLLLDEPTAGLDSETKKAVMSQWRELLSSGLVGGIICVSHDADVLQMADETVTL
ncbi:ABC transporter, putative [Trypanosoma equiperdum]|uniref:ABC transporter, putative n=1 Tax=Trypanosoma equiperdum TaxID=5694 RepID=A0A1G4I6I6_TRYEQ|nr:ABC transporter, putative [Trypanosoma equiperdum]